VRIKTACQSGGVFGTTGFILLATSRYPVEMSCVRNGTVAPRGHSRRARNWTVVLEDMASAKWPSHTGPRCDRNMSRNVHTIPSLPVLSIVKLAGGCAPALLLSIHTLVVRALFLIVASELRAPEFLAEQKLTFQSQYADNQMCRCR
jgi:hypothetical protein